MNERMIQDLQQTFASGWEVDHGINAGTSQVLFGEDCMAVIIPQALNQAEIELFRSSGDHRVFENYIENLVGIIFSEQKAYIEERLKTKVIDILPLIDQRMGWITAFYQFENKIEIR